MTGIFTATGSAGLVDLLVRATILLSLALVLQWSFRKWPAVMRHRLWTLTFLLLLALPALRQFGPSWDMPLLPDTNRQIAADRLEVWNRVLEPSASDEQFASFSSDFRAGVREAEAAASWSWTRLAFVFWAAGCGVAFVSLGVGAWRFSRLVQAGQPVQDEAWIGLLDFLRERLSIRAQVGLVLAEEEVTPMTGGVRRPVILLPASATDWSEARREAVVAHELVHVRRRDALRQLLGRTVLAIYWFHPLSWVASHVAAARREEACDEEVLALGARPSEYARHLLSLAESKAVRERVHSLPMVQQSRLERRVRAILGPHRAPPRAFVGAAGLAVVAVAGVAVSVANPNRPENATGASAEAAGIGAAVDCVPVSNPAGLSGWDLAPGLQVMDCTIQSEVTTVNGVRTIGPADWEVLENELRKQVEAAVQEEGTAGLRRQAR